MKKLLLIMSFAFATSGAFAEAPNTTSPEVTKASTEQSSVKSSTKPKKAKVDVGEVSMKTMNPYSDIWYFSYMNSTRLVNDRDPITGEKDGKRFINGTRVMMKGTFGVSDDLNLIFTVGSGLKIREDEGGSGSSLDFAYTTTSLFIAPSRQMGWIWGAGVNLTFPPQDYGQLAGSEYNTDIIVGPQVSLNYVSREFVIFSRLTHSFDPIDNSNEDLLMGYNPLDPSHKPVEPAHCGDRVGDDCKSSLTAGGVGVSYSLTPSDSIFVGTYATSDWRQAYMDRYTVSLSAGYGKILVFGSMPFKVNLAMHHTVISPDSEGPETGVHIFLMPIFYKGKAAGTPAPKNS